MATDRQTYRHTDRPTDKADYRDAGACSSQHLKMSESQTKAGNRECLNV